VSKSWGSFSSYPAALSLAASEQRCWQHPEHRSFVLSCRRLSFCFLHDNRTARAVLDGLHAAAIAAVPSLVISLPLYASTFGDRALRLRISDIVIQAL